jgi:tRNA dimethylallyltransferase
VIAACGIGYREALDLVEGRLNVEAAVLATTQRTLRYARAQRTWFRRDTRITWLRPDLVSFQELLDETLRLEASMPN